MKKISRHSTGNMSQVQLEERRKRAGKYFQSDKKVTWIAEHLRVSRAAVHQWKKRWIKDGLIGLRRGTYGRTSKLTKHQEAIIRRDMAKGAKIFGYPTDRWTLKKITSHVKKKIRVEYADRSIWHMLRRVGILPLPRSVESVSSVKKHKDLDRIAPQKIQK